MYCSGTIDTQATDTVAALSPNIVIPAFASDDVIVQVAEVPEGTQKCSGPAFIGSQLNYKDTSTMSIS